MHSRVLALLAVAALPAALGWGSDGHRIVGQIAQGLLSDAAKSQVNKILSGMSLADAATWADQIKSDTQWRWASPLHFANTPDELCNFDFSRDCQLNGNKGFCVVGAITNYTQRLPSSRLELIQWFSPTARALRGADLELETDGPSQVALKFLVHFVGDVHQPLHVGQTSDRGGNSISVSLNGHRTNLHALWDTDLVSSAISAAKTSGWSAYASYLLGEIANGKYASDAAEWAKCPSPNDVACPNPWAVESISDACQYAYQGVKNGDSISSSYMTSRTPIVEQRLAAGGVRLAAVLNNLWAN